MPKVMSKKKKKLRREEEDGSFGNKEEGEAVPKMKKKKSNSPIHSSKEGRKNKKKNKVNEDESTLVKDRKEEHVDYLPGQKHDRPGERDPLRIFYETLYHKLPDNELAETWMMEWGLLPPDKAKVVYETKLGKDQQEHDEYRVEDASLKKASKVLIEKAHKRSSNTMLKTKKRKLSENSSGDDSRLLKRKVKKQRTSS